MKIIKNLIFVLIIKMIMITNAFANGNPLSVHVLNLENGLPSQGVNVVLEKKEGEQWTFLNKGVTNQQGRISELYPTNDTIEKGIYRITFYTGEWFKKHNMSTFFPEIPVIFDVDGSLPHYHIPLLLSPYGFSSYRGS